MYFTIEEVLYFYSFVSIALIIYNINYIFLTANEEKKQKKLKNKYIREYNIAIEALKNNKENHNIYYKKLVKELKKNNNILAFNEAIFLKKNLEDFNIYKNFIYTVFLELCSYYGKKSNMEKALFVYIVGNLNINKKDDNRLDNKIIKFLEKPYVYLIENTLNTFNLLGHKESIIKTLNLLNLKNIKHNEKLVSDGFLKYTGNKFKLSKELWEYRSKWNETYVKAIIKFITSMKFDFKEEFYYSLTKEELDNEVRIELVRYFGKVKYNKVLDYILSLLENSKDINLLIVIANTLRNYPSQRTINALKKGIKSTNWYIRNNSCESFLSLNPSKRDIYDILQGEDKYAREILIYQLEKGDM